MENKINYFKKDIPTVLFTNIISFLPHDQIAICHTINVSWRKTLKSNLSKKLMLAIPIKLLPDKTIDVGFRAVNILKIKDDVFVSGYDKICKFDIENSKLINNHKNISYENTICSNLNYICKSQQFPNLDIHIYTLDMELIGKISLNSCFLDVKIDEKNNILVSTHNQFYIYNVNGCIIKQWNLFDNCGVLRRIASYKNEIYMTETYLGRVDVFSYEGKKVRTWNYNDKSETDCPSCIIVCQDIVFVNFFDKIKAFTRQGKYIFKYILNEINFVHSILFVDNFIYTLTRCEKSKITMLKLIWD